MRSTALARISSLTGRDFHPDARNSPRTVARSAMARTYPGDHGLVARVVAYDPLVQLNGPWRVAPADDDLRRDAIGLDVDDSAWAELDVPGHWRRHPDFADSDGPLLHRRRYSLREPAEGRRRWLTLEGVFYQADVWLDGAYLGDPEGYFLPHTFDITALSRMADEHVV